MRITQATMFLSVFVDLATQVSPRAWPRDNCNQGALGPAIGSGLVTQVGRKSVFRDPIKLPSCGKTVSELVIKARGKGIKHLTPLIDHLSALFSLILARCSRRWA